MSAKLSTRRRAWGRPPYPLAAACKSSEGSRQVTAGRYQRGGIQSSVRVNRKANPTVLLQCDLLHRWPSGSQAAPGPALAQQQLPQVTEG